MSWGTKRSIGDSPETIWRNRGYDNGRAGLARTPPEEPAECRRAYFQGFRRGQEQRAEALLRQREKTG